MAMNSTGIGQMTCGKWKFVQEIGRGAYGVVYMATGPDGTRAAVKVCRREDAGDECFERELRGAKLFKSIPPQEGLVRMRDLVETDWGFYTVLDLADDEFFGSSNSAQGYRPKTLASVIAGEKALPIKECVKLAVSLANGLSALQRHHLLHRDIKPGNVVYVGGLPVLSDPGLLIEESDAVSLVGTPGYVPPEKFTDAASDIYSLGLTLKAASFGRQVDELDKGPAMEADTGSACFPAWWRILNKATDPVASRRYQSAKALLKDLHALCRRMKQPRYSWSSSLVVEILVLVVVWIFCVYVNMFNSSGWKEFWNDILPWIDILPREDRTKAVAEKVVEDFMDRRVKEDMPDIKRGIKGTYQSMLNMQREELADKEKEIAELEEEIAKDEARIKEAEKRGDKASKDAIEYGLKSVRYRLMSAQNRKVELEKGISDEEAKLKKMDDEIRRAEDELLKLKECK